MIHLAECVLINDIMNSTTKEDTTKKSLYQLENWQIEPKGIYKYGKDYLFLCGLNDFPKVYSDSSTPYTKAPFFDDYFEISSLKDVKMSLKEIVALAQTIDDLYGIVIQTKESNKVHIFNPLHPLTILGDILSMNTNCNTKCTVIFYKYKNKPEITKDLTSNVYALLDYQKYLIKSLTTSKVRDKKTQQDLEEYLLTHKHCRSVLDTLNKEIVISEKKLKKYTINNFCAYNGYDFTHLMAITPIQILAKQFYVPYYGAIATKGFQTGSIWSMNLTPMLSPNVPATSTSAVGRPCTGRQPSGLLNSHRVLNQGNLNSPHITDVLGQDWANWVDACQKVSFELYEKVIK